MIINILEKKIVLSEAKIIFGNKVECVFNFSPEWNNYYCKILCIQDGIGKVTQNVLINNNICTLSIPSELCGKNIKIGIIGCDKNKNIFCSECIWLPTIISASEIIYEHDNKSIYEQMDESLRKISNAV